MEIISPWIHEDQDDHQYRSFLSDIQKDFDAKFMAMPYGLFTTDAVGLAGAFLEAIPKDWKQHYYCHACLDFINDYGGLVFITNEGTTAPAMWPSCTSFDILSPAIGAVHRIVSKARVTGVFATRNGTLGKSVTGHWHHMSVKIPESLMRRSEIKTPSQVMAEKKEDYRALVNALVEFPRPVAERGVELLKSGILGRKDKFHRAAEWFRLLHQKRDEVQNSITKQNITWREAANAPAGLCHIKTSMIGALLSDIKAGKSFGYIQKGFAEKTAPLQYQRPQAPPSEGNIDQAEKLIERMGLKPSLERRLARLNELQLLWSPSRPEEDKSDGSVFGHLRKTTADAMKEIEAPEIKITWVKFLSEMLPGAENIEVYIHPIDNFITFLTATNPEPPPIIAWDSEDTRNPVSWYVYPEGSPCHQWGLSAFSWVPCIGVCCLPTMWNGRNDLTMAPGAAFILQGCKDSRSDRAGLGLFPEILRSELHGIRSTIEAFSRNGRLSGNTDEGVGGLAIRGGPHSHGIRCRTLRSGIRSNFLIDRWD